MTSNIGAGMISKNTTLGFAQADTMGISYDDMKSRITGELKRLFRPEFLNRVDEVIVFHKLTREEIRLIVGLLVLRTGKQLAEKGLSLEITDAAADLLVDKGYDPTLGARPLRRAIQRYIEDKLADVLLERKLEPGTVIKVDRRDDDTLLTANGEEIGSPIDDLSLLGIDEPFMGPPPIDHTVAAAAGDGQSSLAEVPGES
jgi:ATP-dependent Clp protease ATP-binding subunit ClpC